MRSLLSLVSVLRLPGQLPVMVPCCVTCVACKSVLAFSAVATFFCKSAFVALSASRLARQGDVHIAERLIFAGAAAVLVFESQSLGLIVGLGQEGDVADLLVFVLPVGSGSKDQCDHGTGEGSGEQQIHDDENFADGCHVRDSPNAQGVPRSPDQRPICITRPLTKSTADPRNGNLAYCLHSLAAFQSTSFTGR